MSTSSILLRQLDLAHRLLSRISGSQSTIEPVLGDSPNLPDIYYVDWGNGSDVNDGRDPGFPMATIDAAINKCVDGQGDVILVQPGHVETLTTQISLDVIGVSIIGLGEGTLRPTLTINGGIDGIDIGAANCTVENILFNEATDAAADSSINVDAADATIRRCHFDLGANDDEGSITVTTSGDRLAVEHCTVRVTADGPVEWILFEGIVDRPRLDNNEVVCSDGADAFDTGAINCGGFAITNLSAKGNTLLGGGVAATVFAGIGSLVSKAIGPNFYAGGAGSNDNVGTGEVFGREVVTVTFNGANGQSTIAEHELFTVTGLVHVKIYAFVVSGPTQSTAAIQLGIAGTTDTLIAVTQEEDLDTDELWYDATPDTQFDTVSNAQMTRILNGQDIGYEITADVIDDGSLTFVCEWKALSEGASVIASDGSAGVI